MKNLFLLIFLAFSTTLIAQSFDGTWVGYIYDDNEEIQSYLIVEIEGEKITQYSYDSESESYYEQQYDHQYFASVRNNAMYFWMNQGGAWSETQSYNISLLNEDEAEILWTRQVNNVKDYDDNEVWEVQGKGTMERITDEDAEAVTPSVEAQSFNYIDIYSISALSSKTRVQMIFSNTSDETIYGTFHGPDSENAMYITNRSRTQKYKLTDIEGAEFGVTFSVDSGDSGIVTLTFESIGDLKLFDIIEPGEIGSTWNFYGVNIGN